MPEAHSPTVRGRKLASELRRLRERAKLSAEQAAAQLGEGWSQSKVSRIEGAKVKPSLMAVKKMLDLYGDDGQRAALEALWKDSWKRGWWTDYGDVFRGSYVALEDDAATIDEWSPTAIPGLLQTEDYAREVISASLRGDDAGIQRRVMARMTRKVLLGRTEPAAPRLRAIIDESALRRKVGGKKSPEVMRGQLHALLDVGHRPNVTIQVMSLDVGAHPGMEGAFILLTFPEQLAPDVGYVETRIGDRYSESVEVAQLLRVDFETLQAAALSPDDSAELIAALAEE